MQGQRSTMEFGQGSSSSNSAIDPQVYWRSNILNPIDSRDVADCLLSPEDTVMPLANGINLDSGSFNGWNFTNPESSGNATTQSSLDEAKRDHDWASPVVSSTRASLRFHEVRHNAGNMLPLENVDTDDDQNASRQEYDTHPDLVTNAEFVGNNDQHSGAGLHNFLSSCGTDAQQNRSIVSSMNTSGTSAGRRQLPEDVDGGLRASLDSRHLSGKRKMIEGASGQSSFDGSGNCLHQGENSQQDVSMGNSSNSGLNISGLSDYHITNTIEGLNPSFSTATRVAVSGCHTSTVGSTQNIQRNVRRRLNPANDHGLPIPNLWPPGNSIRHPNIWSPHHPSTSIPFIQLPEVGVPASETQSIEPTVPLLSQNSDAIPWNARSNSRSGSPSSSPIILGERVPSRRIVRSIPIPATDVRRLAQDPTNWNSSTGNVSSTSEAGLVPSSHPYVPQNWPANQIPSMQYPLRLSDFARRSFPSASSDSGVQSSNIQLQGPGHSPTLEEIVPNLVSGTRSQQRHYLRTAFLMDRQNDGMVGAPLPLRIAAVREGRSRMLSEIRSALDFIRRGDNLRFESLLFGGADLHDRHRDMRLDVDNMSYEELLALEERIGNVSTGLSEEIVSKHLKQLKYSPNTLEVSEDVEPCCVCQEEYVEGEDLGTLDCGHGFHAECIKQWLSHKNLCPICKMTALVT